MVSRIIGGKISQTSLILWQRNINCIWHTTWLLLMEVQTQCSFIKVMLSKKGKVSYLQNYIQMYLMQFPKDFMEKHYSTKLIVWKLTVWVCFRCSIAGIREWRGRAYFWINMWNLVLCTWWYKVVCFRHYGDRCIQWII